MQTFKIGFIRPLPLRGQIRRLYSQYAARRAKRDLSLVKNCNAFLAYVE